MEVKKISIEDANSKYGITCDHSIMPNGEKRFRLKKSDGTCYIRTESTPTSRWQNSHYHNKVYETYIVQEGWIAYAELKKKKMIIRIYKKDQYFTTKPFVIHNIYMPKNSVIHTVKHGYSKDEKRLENDQTLEFTKETKKLTEKQIKRKARAGDKIGKQNKIDENYNEIYRHFDNLIWQVPTWSSAIFTAVFLGTLNIKEDDILVTMSGLTGQSIVRITFGVVGFFLFILSYTLYRFRWHQINVKNYTPKNHFISPQVGLQAIVNLQSIIFILLTFSFIDTSLQFKIIIFSVVFLFVTYCQESLLSNHGREGDKNISEDDS